jgi:hypothetical protein
MSPKRIDGERGGAVLKSLFDLVDDKTIFDNKGVSLRAREACRETVSLRMNFPQQVIADGG